MFDHDDDHDHDHGPEHPKDRPMKAEDPLQLNALELDGDPDVLLTCLVEEFARMGWDADMILRTFSQEEYQGPSRLLRALGPEGARRRIEAIIARCGVWKMRIVEQTPQPENNFVGLTVGGHRTVEL